MLRKFFTAALSLIVISFGLISCSTDEYNGNGNEVQSIEVYQCDMEDVHMMNVEEELIIDYRDELIVTLDRFLYSLQVSYGESARFLRRHMMEVNRTIRQDRFEIEIYAALALGNYRASRPFGGNTIRIYLFFSIRDIKGEIDLSHTRLTTGGSGFRVRTAWYEDGVVYFIYHQDQRMDSEVAYVDVDLIINRLQANFQSYYEILDIDIAHLLEKHDASFMTPRMRMEYWWYCLDLKWYWLDLNLEYYSFDVNFQLSELYGMDVDLLSLEQDIIMYEELSIPMAGHEVLTNIALRDELLLIQITQRAFIEGNEVGLWFSPNSIRLVNTNIELQDFESNLTDCLTQYAIDKDEDSCQHDLLDLFLAEVPQRQLSRIIRFYGLGDYLTSDEFGLHVLGYYVPETSILPYLALEVLMEYFDLDMPMHIFEEGIRVPVAGVGLYITHEGRYEMNILSRMWVISVVEIHMTGIIFVIHDAQYLWDRSMDFADDFSIHGWDVVNIELLLEDGSEFVLRSRGSSLTTRWNEEYATTDLHVQKDAFFPIHELIGIRINGIDIRW